MSNLSNEKKRKYRTKIKRRRIVTLCSLVLIIVVLGVVIFKVFFNNKDNKLSSKGPNETSTTTTTSNDTSTASETSSPSQSNNKNGYLSLEEDPNAEDALEVFANTEGLLKGTKTYPVRTDGKKVVYLTFDDGPSTTNLMF